MILPLAPVQRQALNQFRRDSRKTSCSNLGESLASTQSESAAAVRAGDVGRYQAFHHLAVLRCSRFRQGPTLTMIPEADCSYLQQYVHAILLQRKMISHEGQRHVSTFGISLLIRGLLASPHIRSLPPTNHRVCGVLGAV